ncbi:MAG: glycosyltransferase family 2 protein [Pelolinea sp.]|nr:glycosyltransferase family 2 protein [Pelolinea sp.]
MAKLSVLLPTYNEDKMITECLESVKWADEILIVDSFSTDHTLDIARTYGAHIIQHEYINSAKQKNWAIPQCTHEWVLQIDADERLDIKLQAEIKELLVNPPKGFDGFVNPTKNHILGKWIKSMDVYPGERLRLFKRDKGRFEEKEVDAHVIVHGQVGFLKNHVLHFGLESIAQKLKPLDRYTRYEADEREKQGRLYSWFNVSIRPIAVFVYYFIFKLGFLDGMRGLILAAFKADIIFWTYAKLWEKEVQAGKRK